MSLFLKIFFFILLATNLYSTALNLSIKEKDYIQNNQIKVAMLPDFPPFTTFENNKLQGFSYDILQLISQKSGLKFEYKINSWPKNIKDFKEQKVDMIDAISFRTSRVSFTNYTKPYYEIPLVIFSRKELSTYKGLESLQNKKLGITKNIFYKKDIEELNIFKLVEYDSFQEKLKALAFGEVDIIFGHLLSTQISIEKLGYTNLKVLDELNVKNINKTDLRFGITKNNTILYSIIQKSFENISENEWKKLKDKWISIYTEQVKSSKSSQIILTQKEKDFLKNHNIKCMITDNWSPFYFQINGKLVGIGIDFWKLISKKANIQYECTKTNNFDKVLASIKNKKTDITVSTAITKDKLNYSLFSDSYISYPIAIATKINKSFISKTSYLNHKRVAVGRGYSSYKILSTHYPDIHFIQVKDTNEALKLVSEGKAYAAIDILPVLSYKIQDNNYPNLKISGTTKFNFDVRIMVRDDYSELISIINKAISSISEEEKNSIGNKWLAVKYENFVDYSLFWKMLGVASLVLLIILYKHYVLREQHNKLKKTKQKLELTQTKLKTLNDSLEKKVLEEVEKNRLKDMRIVQQSRLAQLGEMISMIAHQWRQPLNAISVTAMNIQLKLELEKFNFEKKEEIDKFIEFLSDKLNNIENFTQSLTLTIDDFRNFYKPNKKHEFLNINKSVKTAINIIKPSFESKSIKLVENYYSQKQTNIFKNELMQVILNILKNSQDQFISHDIKNPSIEVTTRDENNSVQIEISDNAGGINIENITKIFDPYFSTKGEQSGSGLGLYMSKIIIEEHHKGQFIIQNKENGVCALITIPIDNLQPI